MADSPSIGRPQGTPESPLDFSVISDEFAALAEAWKSTWVTPLSGPLKLRGSIKTMPGYEARAVLEKPSEDAEHRMVEYAVTAIRIAQRYEVSVQELLIVLELAAGLRGGDGYLWKEFLAEVIIEMTRQTTPVAGAEVATQRNEVTALVDECKRKIGQTVTFGVKS